nr:hypothetical protein CFP56_16268 [Quercus suber]
MKDTGQSYCGWSFMYHRRWFREGIGGAGVAGGWGTSDEAMIVTATGYDHVVLLMLSKGQMIHVKSSWPTIRYLTLRRVYDQVYRQPLFALSPSTSSTTDHTCIATVAITITMPRKSGGSEAPSESSARTSLRHLGSIASFHTLNPFARRRSNNATTDSIVSESVVSVSSVNANQPEPIGQSSTSIATSLTQLVDHGDNTTHIPAPRTLLRSSPIAPARGPVEHMPRSRTFSHLPVPARLYRNAPAASCKSHSRLPSIAVFPTRLPSPPTTNRKYSGSHLASAEVSQQHEKNRAKRSDTEPLLPMRFHERNDTPRTTAFKENISPGPPYSLSTKDKQAPGSYLSSCASHSNLSDVSELSSASHRHRLSDASAFTHRGDCSTKQSPNLRSSQKWPFPGGQSATPKQLQTNPVQRWHSQPMLSNSTNLRSSQHEIKQVRLMSQRHPPTPLLPRTPAGTMATVMAKPEISSSTRHVRQMATQLSSSDLSLTPKPHFSPTINPYEVHKAEATSYWCGRFAALEDRFRNEELATSLQTQYPSSSVPGASRLSSSDFWPRDESDQMHTAEMTTQRRRRAIEHLYNLCTTVEARDSFAQFQMQFATSQDEPDLARPVQGNRADLPDGGGKYVFGEARKMTLMDRLLGRGAKKRRSVV